MNCEHQCLTELGDGIWWCQQCGAFSKLGERWRSPRPLNPSDIPRMGLANIDPKWNHPEFCPLSIPELAQRLHDLFASTQPDSAFRKFAEEVADALAVNGIIVKPPKSG